MASPPVTRVNTLVQVPYLDPLSKAFIYSEHAILGLNRLPVVRSKTSFCLVLGSIYDFILNIAIILATIFIPVPFGINFKLLQYIFSAVFCLLTWKRIRNFYDELNKFDCEVGCRPKVTFGTIKNVVQLVITLLVIHFIFVETDTVLSIPFLPYHMIQAFENHYYAHLINLLIPRMRLINFYLESSLSNVKIATSPKMKEFKFFGSMNNDVQWRMDRLMDFYRIIVNAHNLLIHAIKWQMLVLVTTSFTYVLFMSFVIAVELIQSTDNILNAVIKMGLGVTEVVSLFAPCLSCDRLRYEVKRLRELLASSLYENRLDKESRSAARALMALTQSRNLSFSLLRMADISISLPFSFIGLLVTYLIILLQFQKVIRPNSTNSLNSTTDMT